MLLVNTFVEMYAKGGSLWDVRQVFDRVAAHKNSSWTAKIAEYSKQGRSAEVINLFLTMQQAGMKPNKLTFVFFLKACASLAALEKGMHAHAQIVQSGLESDLFVGSTLIDVYKKCRRIEDAHQVFDRIRNRDVVSWNTIIAGYAQQGLSGKVLALFEQMKWDGVKPNNVTFVSLLKACTNMLSLEKGKEIHRQVISSGFGSNVFVSCAIMDMYIKCGSIGYARQIFNQMSNRDVVTWTAMIAGYVQEEFGWEALALFQQMQQEGVMPNGATFVNALKACTSLAALENGKQVHVLVILSGFESDIFVGSTLIDMYSKCTKLEDAKQVFSKMSKQTVVAWNAMMTGYSHQGFGVEALQMFEEMQESGGKLDSVTLVSALQACAGLAALERGKQVHICAYKYGFEFDIFVGNSLIDMYAKSGGIIDAREVFDRMCKRDTVSWNALIGGYAQQGLSKEALVVYEELQLTGMKPDEVTLSCVLSACSHGGLVEHGQYHFECMHKVHGVTPTAEHYACMVDLFCRAGLLDEAGIFIDKMPVQASSSAWKALLSGCRSQGNVDLGKHVFLCLLMQEQESVGAYVLLSNIFAQAGR